MIEKWACFFGETRNLDVVPPALSERPFREALDVARSSAFSPGEWEVYQRAKMAEQDARGALVVARQEGIEEGLARGLVEGALKWKRDLLLRFLGRAGIALPEEERARIQACEDAGTLDRWVDNVFGAKTAADVLS